MQPSLKNAITAWEDEGGAASARPSIPAGPLTGTAAQVEWAERIKRSVHDQFDRMAASFRLAAERQIGERRANTEAIIAILEEKRAEVLSREKAGYFIHVWQEIGAQIRQMIFRDPRYQAIKWKRAARRREAVDSTLIGDDNTMNIRPLYDRIVVKRIEEQETTRNGIVIPDSAKEKPQEGEVLAVGHGKRLEDGKLVPLDVKIGDRVLFGKYSGTETELVGTEYIIMREDDVLGVLESTAEVAKELA
jgi:chaperonin GroES